MKIALLTFRGFQFIWTLLIMSLVGNTIAMAIGGNPSIINYVMFVAVFSMLSLFYLIPASISDSLQGHVMIPLTLDALNTIFFFCGAVALAAKLRVHSCGNEDYVNSNEVTSGSTDNSKRCHESQANDAFLWFGFAAYVGSMVCTALASRSGGASLRGGIGGIRRGPPAMSQV